MKKIALLAGLILISSLLLPAQDYKGKGRINGIVTDENGNPLEGVTVKLFSLKAQQGLSVKTDKDGKWLAAWVRGGGWNIDFEKVGYAPKKIVVETSENRRNPEITVSMTKVEGIVMTSDIEELLVKGNELFDSEDYEGALAVYLDIIAKYPDAYPIYRNIGNSYFAQQEYDLAEENYLKLLEKEATNVEATIAIGNCYANRGDAEKAQEWYDKVGFENINDPVVLYNLGTSYYNNAKFDDALKFYKKAAEIQESSSDTLYQLGLTYLNLQRNAEAIDTFESYLKIDPDSPRANQVKSFLDYLRKK